MRRARETEGTGTPPVPSLAGVDVRSVDAYFSPSDRAVIEAAVREVEATSAGEVVPYVVQRSDDYAGVAWTASTLGALLAAGAAALAHEVAGPWGGASTVWIALPALGGAALGYVLAFVAPLRRALVGDETLEQRTRDRATAAFLEQEVFRTRDRTGILLFLSLLEHRVVILADAGITARVAQPEWDAIATGIAAGIRRGEPGRALADGIRRCGELLVAQGPARRPDDTDELSDRLRLGPSA